MGEKARNFSTERDFDNKAYSIPMMFSFLHGPDTEDGEAEGVNRYLAGGVGSSRVKESLWLLLLLEPNGQAGSVIWSD